MCMTFASSLSWVEYCQEVRKLSRNVFKTGCIMGVECLELRGENFRGCVKFVKVFSLKSFPLYGTIEIRWWLGWAKTFHSNFLAPGTIGVLPYSLVWEPLK